jgi:hypothetical protein
MSEFCVYLTIYYGSKLPPFYIGYSTVDKINSGYHGSVCSKKYVKIWQEELKNNSDLFKTKIISICASKVDAIEKEKKFQNHFKVISNPMYINCAIGRLMIGPKIPWNKNIIYSEEQRNKLRKPKKKRTKEHCVKNGASSGKARKGMTIGKYSAVRIDIGRPQPKLICPHCNKVGGYASMNRWHFNNCKIKNG